MSETPPNGLYWAALDQAAEGAELADDHLVVDAAAHGPAGSSSVRLPDGGLLEVDHLDPARFVGAQIGGVDPSSSPLLVALFGGDGAMRIVDAAESGDAQRTASGRDPEDQSRSPGRTPRGIAQLDQDAQRAGRLVVLADLATDPVVEPLARTLAVSELLRSLDSTPGGDLFTPVVPGLVDHAMTAARQVDDDDLVGMDPKLAFEIIGALRVLFDALLLGSDRSLLVELVQRLENIEPELHVAASMAPARDAPSDAPVEFERELGSEPPAVADQPELPLEGIDVVRRSPSLLEVTVRRDDRGRWVRVLRTDGLVLLAAAPLQRDGLMERAELLVPPDTATGDLDVQVLEHDELVVTAGSSTDLMRRAVRTGRAAASAERRGDRSTAMWRWRRCASLWGRLGDQQRSFQAEERGTSRGGRVMADPLLTDELDPYGVEADLELDDRW